jgi:ABC-type nitrate/sulfonate/bicarbonate transport system substrate-binding protein
MLAQKHPVILTELYSSSSQTAIVYRHDRGIQSPADLAHHRVGLNVGTNAEFVLDLLLTSNGVRKSSVEIVPMEWKSHRDALLKGLVDAVVTWEPTATEIISEGTVPAAVVSADFYTEINSLVATRKSAIEKTDEIRRVLRALSRAQEFYRNHPAQSREIVSRHLNPRSSSGFSMFWEKMNPHLGLSSVLVTTLKEEMEWMVRNKMASQVVNVYEMLDPSYLKRLSPELVTYE